MKISRCSRCDETFECGKDEPSCWCMAMDRVKPIEGETCLCMKCLEARIKEQRLVGQEGLQSVLKKNKER